MSEASGQPGPAERVRGTLKATARKARWMLRRRPADNFAYNRELWDLHAATWDEALVRRDLRRRAGSAPDSVRVLGEEWGSMEDVRWVVDELIAPNVGPESTVAEIGPGGGRLTLQVVDRVAEIWCFDVSRRMLERLAESLEGRRNARLVLLREPRLPAADASFDFVFAFDVFVHFDLHMLWRYLGEVERVLRPGGRALIHTTDLSSPLGWQRFAAQDAYRVETHFFVTPETVRALLSHTALAVEQEPAPDPSRPQTLESYIALLRKSTGSRA